MIGLPFRIAFLAPVMATGTMGTWAFRAMMNPPFLNGKRAPVRLRVPSGKIRNEAPARRGFGRAVDCRQALLGIAALEGDEARQVEPAHEDRQLAQFGLVENPQAGKEFVQRVEENRRLDVAGVVDGVDGGAMPLDILRALDMVANAAQPETDANTQTSYVVEDRSIPDGQRIGHERRADDENVERDGDERGERADGRDDGTHG